MSIGLHKEHERVRMLERPAARLWRLGTKSILELCPNMPRSHALSVPGPASPPPGLPYLLKGQR